MQRSAVDLKQGADRSLQQSTVHTRNSVDYHSFQKILAALKGFAYSDLNTSL